MIVFSAFDGISCGMLALLRAGITPSLYFASEVDKFAIQVSRARFGNNIVQVGDIQQVNESLCLLENVDMKKEDMAVITKAMGVEPILINSNLVSAQNRPRHYWTNIPGVTQPRDRRIFFPNIAEYGIPRLFKKTIDPSKHFNLSQLARIPLPRPINFTLRRSAEGRALRSEGFRKGMGDLTSFRLREYHPRVDLKINCINTKPSREYFILDEDNDFRYLTMLEIERLQTLPDGYTDGLGLSDSRRLKLIGNGWTVDTIAHILNFIPYERSAQTTSNIGERNRHLY